MTRKAGNLAKGRGPHRRRGCGLAAAAGLALGVAALPCRSDDAPPNLAGVSIESLQRGQVSSLLEETGLRQRHVLDIAFEEDGTVWLAASDGLYRYDGYGVQRLAEPEGLPSAFVRAVCWTRERQLWVGTDRGAGVYDGRRFDFTRAAGRLAGPSVRRIRETADGALWFCCDRWPDASVHGGLTRLDAQGWTSYTRTNAASLDHTMDLFRDSRGRVFALTQSGLLEKRGEQWLSPLIEAELEGPGETFWSMAEVPGQGLMANTFTGVFRFDEQRQRWVHLRQSFPTILTVASTREGEFLGIGLGAKDSGAFKRWNGEEFVVTSEPFRMPEVNTVFLAQAPDGSLWTGGYDYLMRWDRRGEGWTVIDAPLPPPALVDRSNRVWLVAADAAWHLADGRIQPVEGFPGGEVRRDEEGNVWGWNDGGLYHWTGPSVEAYHWEEFGCTEILDLRLDAGGRPWFCGGRPEERLRVFVREGGQWHFVKLGEYERWSLSSSAADPRDGLWYVFLHRHTGESRLVHARRDGLRPHPVGPQITPFSRLAFVAETPERGWLYGQNLGLFACDLAGTGWRPVPDLPGNSVRACVLGSNEVWFALGGFTGGRAGLARVTGDRCDRFELDVGAWGVRADDGSIYFAGERCLYAIPDRGPRVPMRMDLPSAGLVRGVVKDQRGDLYVGVGDRVMRHRPRSTAPQARILCADMRRDAPLRFTLEARQRFSSRTSTHSYEFSYRVDDGPWSPFAAATAVEIPAPGLRVGRHVLAVRVRDEGYNLSRAPAPARFSVLPVPLQERAWFRPLVAGVFLTVLALVAVLQHALRKLARHAGELEARVADRTASLQESEEKYRALVENAAEGIFVAQNGVIQFANQKCEEVSGYPRTELNQRSFQDLIHPDDRQLVMERHARRHQDQSVPAAYSFRFLHRSGDVRWGELKVVPILWAGKEATLNFMTDITERKRAEEERTRLEEQFQQAQKMESVGRLAGGVAHDFNNMLQAILGNVELALQQTTPGTELHHDLAEIHRAAQRSADLTRQLLAFARKQTVQPRVLDLNSTIGGMLSMLRRLIGEDIHLLWVPGPDLWPVKVDPGQIDQIVANLTVNARDAIAGVGCITIETANVSLDASYVQTDAEVMPGDYVQLAVRDNGRGMGPEVRGHLFEPFFTTKDVGKGTGLGLATVFGIVKQNHGSITVESQPGQGSVFRIYLPRAEAERVFVEEQPAPRSLTGTETVLLVEDEEKVLQLGHRILTRLGYTLLTASTPQAALDLAARHSGRIDLLVTDVVMPGMNGMQLRQRLEPLFPGLRCLFISGYTADLIAPHGILDSEAEFLQKPFSTQALAERVRSVLDSTPRLTGSS